MMAHSSSLSNSSKSQLEAENISINSDLDELHENQVCALPKCDGLDADDILGDSASKKRKKSRRSRKKLAQKEKPKSKSTVDHQTDESEVPVAVKYPEFYDISKEYDEIIAKNLKLVCNLCEFEAKNFSEIKKHYLDVHRKRGYVMCCNRKFYERTIMVDHINTHNNPELFKCLVCQKVLADRRGLTNHMETMHQTDEEKAHKCELCSKNFIKKYLLDNHNLQYHTPVETLKFSCDVCQRTFGKQYLLNKHIKDLHTKPYVKMCHMCGKKLRSKDELEKHQMEHAGIVQPQVQCEVCGIWLKNEYCYKRHVYRHKTDTEDTVYTCDICGKTSKTNSALRSHKSYAHNAARSHKCTICEKAFKKAITLREHMASHTGLALYGCQNCGKTFNSGANYHSHRKKVHPQEWEESRKFGPSTPIARAEAASVSSDNYSLS